MSFFQLGLRRAAAQLARPAFVCGQCLRGQQQQRQLAPIASSIVQLARARRSYATTTNTTPAPKSPIAALASEAAAKAAAEQKSKSSSFPETNDKVVGYWLLGSAVSVFGIVVFGGLTRLTESGYVTDVTCSDPEWKAKQPLVCRVSRGQP